MNKRFSTLLAAALVAGSFSSAFAQLEGRNVEWKDAQASRAYYLAGVHFVSPTDYLQAFSLQGLVNGADITAANPVAAAQWTVETKKVGTVTHYAFKNIEGEQYLAFEKKDGAYALAAKKEANDETKSFRWFTVAANGNLQAVLSDEKEPYFLGLKNDGTADWSLALLQSSEHHTDGSTSVIKKKVALYEIYNDQITAEAFASKFGENFTIEFPETLDDMDVFENVSVEKIANDNLGFKLVDNKGTKDTKDDEYVVLANERVSNSELAANAIGYRYAKMTAKAIKDKKIDDKNTVFYAEENETNIGDGKYALVQKVKVGDLDNKDVTFGKVTNDETTRQLASVEYDCHSTFMGVTVGKGTRVANTEVANERMLIVNVTAKVADKKNSFLLKKKLAELTREKYKPDIIVLEWTQCVLTRDLVHIYFPDSKIVASEHDLSVVGFQRKVEAAEKGFTTKKLEEIKRLELGALAQCDMTFFHSREDLKRAKNIMPQCKDKFSSIVPYYDDYSTVEWKSTTKNIVFFGALNRVENVKSAVWFYENVFCKLRDKSWKLILLGSHPDEKLVFLSQQDERVIVTGFVKDIRPWLQNCACMIAPLVMGAGIKVKVLEALSAGIPLLTNEIGMEGINAENEKEYFHCQTAGDYIRVLNSFFDSEDKLTAMSIAEKKFVKNNFDKQLSYEKYRDSLLHIAGKK